MRAVPGRDPHEKYQLARAGEGPRGWVSKKSPDVAVLMRTPVDKAGEENSLQYDRSPCSLNAVAVDLPWGGLLGAISEGINRISGKLVGVLIGRERASRPVQPVRVGARFRL